MSVQSLTERIKIAIAKRDITALYELKDICDYLHTYGEPYKNYTPEDLPPDSLYEEMVRLIDSTANDITSTTIIDQATDPNVKHRHTKLLSDMWMGSITKETEIVEIKDAMLMPKFDGCSCGVKLKRYTSGGKFELVEALTRGVEEGYTRNRSNITERFNMIAARLVEALNSPDANAYIFSNEKPFANVLQLTLRGEIVLRDRTLTDSAPASVVAGKINGHLKVWTESLAKIEFIPYEIMRFNYDLTDYFNNYVPTQNEVIDFFTTINLINFPVITQNLTQESLSDVQDYFASLHDAIPQPMDGVVYCPNYWRYPITKEATTPKQYGKYAWKPSSEATSILRNITYSLARDGKITFMLNYDPVRINGKNYRNAKTATSRMIQLEGIGIGSVITVKLAGDISPMITDFLNADPIEPFTFPTTCPFCNTKTILKTKSKTPTFSCPNPLCPEVVKQKMINFLSILKINGIAAGKLSRLSTVTLSNVVNEYLDEHKFITIIGRCDVRTFLVALGIGGTQAVSKRIKSFSIQINPLDNVKNNFESLCAMLEEDMEKDPFIKECIDYIDEILNE